MVPVADWVSLTDVSRISRFVGSAKRGVSCVTVKDIGSKTNYDNNSPNAP